MSFEISCRDFMLWSGLGSVHHRVVLIRPISGWDGMDGMDGRLSPFDGMLRAPAVLTNKKWEFEENSELQHI